MPSVFDLPDDHHAQEAIAALPRMLLGDGTHDATARLRAECSQWLPPYEAEETRGSGAYPSDYVQRVGRAVVEPFYERAILRDVASVVGRPIVLRDDVPLEIRGDSERGIEGWAEDIDRRGNDLTIFTREVVRDAAGDRGFSTVLVDFPTIKGKPKLSDLIAAGLRPYWRHYRARDVIQAIPEYVAGRERLAEVRLFEKAPEDFERVRVLRAAMWTALGPVGFVSWELWERSLKSNDRQGYVVEYGTMEPHTEIPLVPLYYERAGFFRGRNAYMALARLNLLHTQQASDIRDDLWLSSGAQLVMTGATAEEDKQRVIGRRYKITLSDPSARVEWLERSGNGARVYREEQRDLEAKMERLANEPHLRRSGNETATGRAIDTAEARTEIQARCIAVKDFVEQLLMFTAAYYGAKTGGSVDVVSPMSRMERDMEGTRLLRDLVNDGTLTRETLLEVVKRQGMLPDDVDVEAEAERAQAAKASYLPELRPVNRESATARVRAAIAAAERDGNPPPSSLQ